MLLLVPALLALLVALVQGGSLRHLAELPIRGSYLLMTSFLIQLVIYLPALRHSTLILTWAAPLYIGVLALAVAGMLRNWHLGPAARIVALGLALNVTVIVLNGGHMPANAAAMQAVQGQEKVRELADTHLYHNTQLATASSRLVILSDVIPVNVGGFTGNVYSFGDALIAAGAAALVYQATRRRRLAAAPGLV